MGVKTNIDALALNNDGHLIFSTHAKNRLLDENGQPFLAHKQDLIEFTGSTGEDTAGSFKLFFDGQQADLAQNTEDIDGVDVYGPYLYLVTQGKFKVGPAAGNGRDMLRCDLPPVLSLPILSCGNPLVVFKGTDVGLNKAIQGIQVKLSLNIALSSSHVDENQPADTAVGHFSMVNADKRSDYSYTLISGDGATDNASFKIDGDALQTAASFDFETQPSYRIRVRSDENGGRAIEKAFTIAVNDVNDAPTDIALSAETIAENQPENSLVGELSTSDTDAGESQTYTLVPGSGDDDNAAFRIVGNRLQTAAAFDFETQPTYRIRVRSTDHGGLFTEKQFTIGIVDANEAPTDILLSYTRIAEGQPAGTLVGTLGSVDADAADTHTYALADPSAYPDNAAFQIVGEELRTAAVLDFPTQSSYQVHIRSTDSGLGALTFDKSMTITVDSINHAPVFTVGPDQHVNEDAGAQSVAGWATAIGPGRADESGQSLIFAVTGNTNPDLFTEAPVVAVDGTLSYALAPGASGSAVVTLLLQDDGGTANGGSDASAPQSFTITVNAVNDAPSFTQGADQNVNEDAGAQTVPGWATAISAGAANEAGQTLTFNVAANDNPGLFSAGPAIDPATGDLTFTPAANANGTATLQLTLTDNGGTDNGGADTSVPQSFTITVNSVNDAPSFTQGADPAVNEGAGAQTVAGWASAISPGPLDEAAQTLTFQITANDNAELFSAGPALDTSGNLTFTPAPDANGTANIQVTLMDNGGTANGGSDTSVPQSFTITVNPVNDAPSFAKGADQTVFEDAGAQTVPGWATAISAGPANESGQTLTFNVTANDNPELFSAGPAVDPVSGDLTFTPAANANGAATLQLTLKDNGGTANGGSDTSVPQSFTITVNPVNDAPSFTAGANQSVNEDAGAQTVPGWATAISAGAADEAAQTLTFVIIGNTNPGLFAVAPAMTANGTLSYTPAADAHGVASIQIALTDDGGTANGGANTSAPTTFTITVNSVNDAPSFAKGADQTVLEDAGTQTVPGWATAMSAGPANESGQTLTFNVTANDNAALFSAGPAVNPATGALTFTPAANANGTANIKVALMDDGGTANGGVNSSGSQSFTITVNAVNDAPAGTDKTVTALEDGDYVFSVDDFGFTDPDDSSANALLSVKIATLPDTGSLTLSGSAVVADTEIAVADLGDLKFTPAANANGASYASFTFQVRDNGGTADGGIDLDPAAKTITVNVTSVNDAPAGTDNTVTTDEDVDYAFNAGDFGFADTDDLPANALLSVKIATLPGSGSLTLSHTEGTEEITEAIEAGTDIAATAIAAGRLKFVPEANANGAPYPSFTFQVRDDGGTDNGGSDLDPTPRTITVNVTSINDAPVNAVPQTTDEDEDVADQTTNEDTALVFNEDNSNRISVSDVDADSADLKITLDVSSGSLTLGDTNDLAFAEGDGTDDATMTFTGNLTAINAALDGLSFQPAPDATEHVTLTLTSDDQGATGAGGALSATDTVTIDIIPVNDAPVVTMPGATPAYAGSAVVLDGTATVSDIDSANFNNGVLIADIITNCEDDDRLALLDQGAGAGHITLDGNTVQYDFDGSGPTAIGQLATDFDCDDETSPSLTVTLNASADPVSTQALLRNLTYASAAATPSGTERTLRVTLSDGEDTSNPVDKQLNIDNPPEVDSVTPANSATDVAVSSSIDITFTEAVNATADAFSIECPEGNAVAFTSNPTLPASNATAFQLTPNAALPYGDTCTVMVHKDEIDDSDAIDPPSGMVADFTSTFTTVVNTAPSFTKGADQTANEDAGAQSVSGWATDISDGDGNTQVLTFNVTGNTNPDLFSAGPSVSSAGVLTYTPAANANGSATITLTLSDNGGTVNGGVDTSTAQTFVINVTPVNDAPSFTKGSNQTVLEDAGAQTVPGWATEISVGPADEAGQTLTFNITGNTNPTLFSTAPAISSTGQLTYTPAANANGSATITLTLSDSGGTANGGANTSAAQTFVINVTAVNDAPSFTKGADQTVDEDAGPQTANPWATAISAGPADEAGQILTFSVTNNTNTSLFSAGPAVSSTGVLTYTPAANQNGNATITLQLSDNGGTTNGGVDFSGTQTFTLTVNPVNDPPVAQTKNGGSVQANMKRTGIDAGLLSGVTDADAGINGCSPTFSVASISSGTHGTVSNVNLGAGTFDFEPEPGYIGAATATYTVKDNGCPGTATSASATINMTVSGPVVWFVNPAAGTDGTGTLASPFNSLASANTAKSTSANHRIFVYNGTTVSGVGVTLSGAASQASAQWLIGQGATNSPTNTFDALMGISPPDGTIDRPTIGGIQPQIQGTLTLNGNNVRAQGFNLSTGANPGINDAAGAISGVTVDQASVSSTTGSAVNLSDFGGTVSLTAVSSNGAVSGIVLNNTTGSFTVTGSSSGICGGQVGSGPPAVAASLTAPNSADCTGGTIQNTSGAGIVLTNASNVSLTRLWLKNSGNDGIQGTNVTGFTLASSLIENNGDAQSEANLDFGDASSTTPDGLHGTASITNSTIRDTSEKNISVRNSGGSALSFTMTGSQISDPSNDATTDDDGMLFEALSTANMSVNISGSYFASHRGDHFQSAAANSGVLNIAFTNNTLSGGHPSALGQGITINAATGVEFGGYVGRVDYDINGNNINGAISNGITVALGTSSVAAVFDGFVRNNVIGTSGSSLSCSTQANGVYIDARGNGTHNSSVTGNTIRQCYDRGILSEAGDGDSVLNLTVQSNTIDQQVGGDAREAIQTNYGITSTNVFGNVDTNNVCLQLGGAGALANIFSHGGGAPDDFRLRKRQEATVRLPGYTGGTSQSGTDLDQVVGFIRGQNTGSAGEPGSASASGTGGGYTGGAACTLPSL